MTFADGIQQYAVRKRAEGIGFVKGESYLTSLFLFVGDVQLGQVTAQQVLAFLNGSLMSAATWRMKYFVLQHFFDFWAARGAIPEMRMPPIRPQEKRNFFPYVYSRPELIRLLKATTRNYKAHLALARPTMRVLIILLYGTGARVGEVLNLGVDDVNLKQSNILINPKDRNRCRLIPIGADLREVLQRYLKWRATKTPRSPRLLLTKAGHPVKLGTADNNFKRLREIAKVTRKAEVQPRLSDMQCTFAVHRITSWIRQGTDLNRMLPALSVYMGLVGLSATERYLHMTPARFKKHLSKLSPRSRKQHWRNDKNLMEFLANL